MKAMKSSGLSDKFYLAFVYLFVWSSIALIVFPLVNIVSSSFSSPSAVSSGKVLLWPIEFSLEGYKTIFTSKYIVTGFYNSVIYTVIGTIVNVIVTLMAAYPLSRKDLPTRNVFMLIFTFTMLFNGGMVPTFLVVNNLHLIDTIWGVVLPSALSVWNLIITRTYMQHNISPELYESASLDGCGDIKFLIKVGLPLCIPIIAVITLLYAVGRWNAFFEPLIYLNTREMMPLQIVLRNILITGGLADMALDASDQDRANRLRYLLQYSLIIVSSVPLMMFYPFIQKYFLKGIMVGAIKG